MTDVHGQDESVRKRRREYEGGDASVTAASSSSRQPSEQPGGGGGGGGGKASSPHSRASGEKRSRRGCQMCKTRRKKCPEDFAFRADGTYGCSTCFQKGLACGERGGGGGGGGGVEVMHTLISSKAPPRIGGVSSSLTNAFETTRHAAATMSTQQPVAATAVSVAAAIAPVDLTLDSSWLDDFFKEVSTLSDPIYQDAMWLANSSGTSAPSSRTSAPTVTTVPPTNEAAPAWPLPDDAAATTTAASSTTSNDYDRIVQSDELDALLERYSPLYEKLWRAAFSVSHPDNTLTKAILALSRASKSCRAATVAVCLSYHHLMQRERATTTTANPRNSMGLSHFLLSAEGSATATTTTQAMQWHNTAEDRVGMAYKWLQFATDEYKRSGRQGTLEQRLATLLNLRWTIITLDGGNAGQYYMDEIRSLIRRLGVTTGYMRQTARRGTVLTVLVLSALATDVFESATKRSRRCALRHSPLLAMPSPSTSTDAVNGEVLGRDLQAGPLYDYEFTSCLSEGIIECIMLISNLDADRHEGRLTKAEHAQQAHEVETTIKACHFRTKADLQGGGAAMVRATALHEMWRQAVLIHYYQVVQQLGPLASSVQACLQQVLTLSSMVSAATQQQSASETWDMWMVWFLAASVAVTAEQRAKCLRSLEALGSEQAVLDDIKVAKLVWRETDDTGHTQDWRVVAEKNGVGVCFAF